MQKADLESAVLVKNKQLLQELFIDIYNQV